MAQKKASLMSLKFNGRFTGSKGMDSFRRTCLGRDKRQICGGS